MWLNFFLNDNMHVHGVCYNLWRERKYWFLLKPWQTTHLTLHLTFMISLSDPLIKLPIFNHWFTKWKHYKSPSEEVCITLMPPFDLTYLHFVTSVMDPLWCDWLLWPNPAAFWTFDKYPFSQWLSAMAVPRTVMRVSLQTFRYTHTLEE